MKLRTIVRISLLALVACGTDPELTYVARIGETSLSKEDFKERAQKLMETGYKHFEDVNEDAKLALLNGVIARELLVREGLRRGLDRELSIAREVERTEQRAVMNKLYEEEALHGDYTSTEEELRAFAKEREYDVEVLSRQIVCATEEEALEVLMALQEGSPFESLVPIYSTETIQRRFGPAGQLGWFKMGHMLPELMEPLRTMDEGQLYPHPVKTQIGYHVFRLDKRRHVDFAAQREWLQEKARVQKRADDMEQYVHRLRREYELEAHDEGLKALTAPDGEEQVLFSWRGGQLTTAAYWANLAASHTRLDSAARYKAAENLAGVQIMMAEGRKLQYDRDPEVREPVEQKRDALIVEWLYRTEGREVARQQPITEEDVRVYYDANAEMFTRTDGKVADLSLVYNSIKTLLRQQAATKAMDAFIARLRDQYSEDIEINTEALAEVSLQVLAQPGEDADKGE
ncbi:MAG: hypothetical protein F4184_13795 [Gemmatimonadetes bacterium]|nr:hypothetical protein [Gemmatimonadota bacterium]